MALAATAAIAATTAAGMYINGKTHIVKDLQAAHQLRRVTKLYAEAERNNSISLYKLFLDSLSSLTPTELNAEAIWSVPVNPEIQGCYTWAQTLARANQYGHWFLENGVRPGGEGEKGELVAFFMMNSADFVLAWLGCWSIGGAPALINYNLTGSALIHCLRVANCKLIIVDEDSALRERIEEVRETIEGELGIRIVIMSVNTLQQIASCSPEVPDEKYRKVVKGNWPICLLYTSGTTGMPKGCPFNTDRGFMVGASRMAGYGLTIPGDRWYNSMPLYHGTGGIIVMTMLIQNTPICLGRKFSTSTTWSDLVASRATCLTYVGETARYLLAAPPSQLDRAHSVRLMYGNGLRPDVWGKFRERFGVTEVVEFFNSTEGVFGLAVWAKGEWLQGCVGHHGLLSRLGTRKTLVPVRIDEDSGAIAREASTGLAIRESYETGGEMIVKVPSEAVFSGYYGNAEATEKRFARDVFEKGDLWYRSGDALRRDSEGRWFFLDRLGDTFRWKGENVSTAEVSEVVGRFPGVVEANVYGVAVPGYDGRAGCAAIYFGGVDEGTRKGFDFRGLLEHCRLRLPRYAVPVFLRVVERMTPIHNNKQNKVPLRKEGVDLDEVAKGEGKRDVLYWVRGDTFVVFEERDWKGLTGGKIGARL